MRNGKRKMKTIKQGQERKRKMNRYKRLKSKVIRKEEMTILEKADLMELAYELGSLKLPNKKLKNRNTESTGFKGVIYQNIGGKWIGKFLWNDQEIEAENSSEKGLLKDFQKIHHSFIRNERKQAA